MGSSKKFQVCRCTIFEQLIHIWLPKPESIVITSRTSGEFASVDPFLRGGFFNGRCHHRGRFRSIVGEKVDVKLDDIAGAGCTEKVIGGRTCVAHLKNEKRSCFHKHD